MHSLFRKCAICLWGGGNRYNSHRNIYTELFAILLTRGYSYRKEFAPRDRKRPAPRWRKSFPATGRKILSVCKDCLPLQNGAKPFKFYCVLIIIKSRTSKDCLCEPRMFFLPKATDNFLIFPQKQGMLRILFMGTDKLSGEATLSNCFASILKKKIYSKRKAFAPLYLLGKKKNLLKFLPSMLSINGAHISSKSSDGDDSW